MIPIIFDKDEVNFNSNGLGRLVDTISAEVTEERNGVYELSLQYPVDGANFDYIIPGRVIGVTHDDSYDIQPFDIVGYTRPIDGVVTFHCVHISYRLSEYSFSTSASVNSLVDAMYLLNEYRIVSPNFPFTISADFTASGYASAFSRIPRTMRQLLGGMEGSVLDTYGGEFEWDRFNAVLHKTRGQVRDFAIRYGVNMIDFNDETDYEGTFNYAIPYWTGNDEVVTGSTTSSGNALYSGRNVAAPLDLTDKFQSKPTSAQLAAAAKSYMQNNNTAFPKQNIKVDFIRLQDSPEYSQYANLMQCGLCDSIQVIFPDYNMSGYFKIVRTVWDVLEGRYLEMELGDLATSLSDALGLSGSSGGGSDLATVFGTVNNSSGSVVIGNLAIEWGQKSITTGSSSAGGTYGGSASIDFTYTYAYNPQVMLTWAGNYGNQVSLNVYSVSTTGATVYGRTNEANSDRTIRWLAIGQKA